MSRWDEQFKSHQFRPQWDALKAELATETVDVGANPDLLGELARLKKVVGYIDGLLGSLDPELVPYGSWDSFHQQVVACLNQLRSYKQTRGPQHLQQANAHADNFVSYIRPYVLVSGRIAKSLREAAQAYAEVYVDAAKQYQALVDSLVKDIEGRRDAVKKISEEVERSRDSVGEIRVSLLGEDGSGGDYSEVKKATEEVVKMHDAIDTFHSELLVGDEKSPSTRSEINATYEVVEKEKERIVQSVAQAQEVISALKSFHAKVYGVRGENGVRQGGLSSELDTQKKKMDDFAEAQSIRYKALTEQIESLLPGATSAGLASAYRELKDSFNGPIDQYERRFYQAIGILVTVSLLLTVDSFNLWPLDIKFVHLSSWQALSQSLLYRLPFYGPLVWFAYYVTKRRSEFQRLQQEYAHKEALAKSYDSFKKQIMELGEDDSEMLKALLNKAVDAISHNASRTLTESMETRCRSTICWTRV